MPPEMELVQLLEREAHALDGSVARELVAPASAALRPLEELDVAHAVRDRAQRGDERDLIGWVVDRPQARDEVSHLLRLHDELAALDPIGHEFSVERALETPQVRARRDQYGGVAGPCRPWPAGRAPS